MIRIFFWYAAVALFIPTAGIISTTGLFSTKCCAAESLSILPQQTVLGSKGASQQLLVERTVEGKAIGEAQGSIVWQVSDPNVAKIVGQTVTPLASGKTTITATINGQTATASILVRDIEQPQPLDFQRHVLPILAKQGCNSGACHGALAGKGGFRLSLRGYDPKTDHWSITRQARGRRIEPSDPGRSLFLAKPSGGIAHRGGLRLEVDSPDYRLLARWIADGSSPPSDGDATLTSVEVFPPDMLLRPDDKQQLIVRARYSDGREEDVTRWAKFTSSNATVADVSSGGKVSVIGQGEGAISVWFSSQIVLARVTSPYANVVAPEVYEKAPRRNFIDAVVLDKLASLNLAPSPRATDEEFLRRVYLDTIGTLPTLEEARSFLDDQADGKRDKLIESLLTRKEFVDYWTYKWSDLLLVNGRRLRPIPVKSYYNWIRKRVEDNTGWDVMVREIITATGSSHENGATNFFALHQSPENMSENASQAFLGLSIGCAKCHNHPLEKWTNDQYYAMANMFARVRSKGWGGDSRSGDGLRTLYVASAGDLLQPRTGRPQPPAPLDAQALAFDSTEDRRVALAAWITSPDNPYFSRAIVNRIWANYFGVGLVHQTDDLRASNPASNERLLAAASQYLVDNKFDLKALMRIILQSETYQRSSVSLPENKDDRRFYSRYYAKRLMAEVLLDAISQVSEVPSEFNQIAFDGADFTETKEYPIGTRAIQLYDSAVHSPFLKTFGRNERDITCECERTSVPSLVQVLHINNGDTINKSLRDEKSCVAKALASEKDDPTLIDEAFLRTLSRWPTKHEKDSLLSVMAESKDAEHRVLIEDLYWSILSSREFIFNH